MSTALLNIVIFAAAILVIWLVYRLVNSAKVLQGRKRKRKTLTEDILKQLYHVEQSKRSAILSDLSGALKVRRHKLLPVVVEMTNSSLVQLDGDTINLTNLGRDYALKIVRIHRLWEKYLAEQTGYKPSDWHYLAEKMEHKLSDLETRALDNALGNPLFDPHGDPIPSSDGAIIEVKWTPLPSFPVNQPCKIVHIEDEPGVIYQQILSKRLFVGSHLKLIESTEKKVMFLCEGAKHSFSPIIAANISVQALSKEEAFEEMALRLSALTEGETANVIGISQECRGASRRRLLDLGILPGTPITVDLKSPLNDPIAYRVRNTSIALRSSLADFILIKKIDSYEYQ